MTTPKDIPSPSTVGALASDLYREHEPSRRKALEDLLCEEENKFGALAWQLDMADAYIKESEMRIARQKELIRELTGKGHDMVLPTKVLSNMEDVRRIFLGFRKEIDRALNNREERFMSDLDRRSR